jgi:hypothetical protein
MVHRALGLTRRQMAYNTIHSWYRTTIEHCFAYVKRSASSDARCWQDSTNCNKLVNLLNFCCLLLSIRYKIIGSKYRGHYKRNPEYLERALKIIMHISSAYTQHNRQRRIRAIAGMPAPPAAQPDLLPPPPDVDTGVRREQLRRGMQVQVWCLDDWWWGRVHGFPGGRTTVNVKFLGQDYATTGILPRHIKIV